MTSSKLAIIIPAYKADFLDKTLASLSYQTNKEFVIYIGDDNSPYNLEDIVNKYIHCLNIKYKRFPDNLGGRDLVSQWERCIALSDDEEWIWLFSDDDEMDNKCVECFYSYIEQEQHHRDIYRYNVKVVDHNNKILRTVNYPNVIDSWWLYKNKTMLKKDTFVVEYIFSRQVYEEMNGFVHFDLAWGSDVATWVKFGSKNKIETIEGPNVYWRSSGENISTILSSDIIIRKIKATIEYLSWGDKFFSNKNIYWINSIAFVKILTNYYCNNKDLDYKSFLEMYIKNKIIFIVFYAIFRIRICFHLLKNKWRK